MLKKSNGQNYKLRKGEMLRMVILHCNLRRVLFLSCASFISVSFSLINCSISIKTNSTEYFLTSISISLIKERFSHFAQTLDALYRTYYQNIILRDNVLKRTYGMCVNVRQRERILFARIDPFLTILMLMSEEAN